MYETLANSPFFNGLTAKEIKDVLQTINYKIVEYPAKEIYTLAGMPCKYADFILKGELISRMTGLSGKQVQIDRLKACILIAPAFIFAKNNAMPVSVETTQHTYEFHSTSFFNRRLSYPETSHGFSFYCSRKSSLFFNESSKRTTKSYYKTNQ